MDSMAEDDDWWQIQHGSGAGSPPLMVLLMTADRMKDFRSGLAGADINTQEFICTQITNYYSMLNLLVVLSVLLVIWPVI